MADKPSTKRRVGGFFLGLLANNLGVALGNGLGLYKNMTIEASVSEKSFSIQTDGQSMLSPIPVAAGAAMMYYGVKLWNEKAIASWCLLLAGLGQISFGLKGYPAKIKINGKKTGGAKDFLLPQYPGIVK